MKKTIIFVFLCAGLSALFACGQTGPLSLPITVETAEEKPNGQTENAPVKSPAKSTTPSVN